VLRSGAFAVTAELDPPDSADPEDVYQRARVFDGYVDAINATDGSGANCHMSSLAVCALLTRVGYAPVMQISCRDKNRIAIQGDILGGAAMGVAEHAVPDRRTACSRVTTRRPNRCLTWIACRCLSIGRNLRDEHKFPKRAQGHLCAPRVLWGSGQPLCDRLLNGAPSASGQKGGRRRAVSSRRSIATMCRASGASCSRWKTLGSWPTRCLFWSASGHCVLPRQPTGCAPTFPASTSRTAVIKRMAGAEKPALEGRQICIDLIQEIAEIKGVSGVHVMALPPGRYGGRTSSNAQACWRGGCPGTLGVTPPPANSEGNNVTDTIISSATKEVVIGFDRPFVIIGERINPTGRKIMAAEMMAGDYSRVVCRRPGPG